MTTTLFISKARKIRGVAASAIIGATVMGLGLSATVSHAAEDYPNKPIRYLLHVSPGGGTDTLARILAKHVEPIIGQPLVVENRPGGQMGVQIAAVTASEPDGYTIGSTTGSIVAQINSTFKGTYDVDTFEWVVNMVTDSPILVVNDSVQAENLDELVELVKANPGDYSVGGTVDGSTGHIAWEMFAHEAGISSSDVPYVPYDSQGDSVTANVGNHVPIGVAWPGIVRDHVEAGNLRVLAVLSDERLEAFPDSPTFREAGYDVDPAWQQFRGIYMPKGTPMDIQQKFADAVLEAMQNEELQQFVADSNLSARTLGPEEFTQFVRRQNELTAEWVERLELGN